MFKAIVCTLCIVAGILLWAAAHYEFGFYLDRAHSKGSRIYRVNSYEQFIQQRTGETTMAAVA